MTPGHQTDVLGPELTKALHDAQALQEELAKTHSASASRVTVSVTGTVGTGSGTSACTVNIHGDKAGDAAKIAGGLIKQFPNAVCTSEKNKTVNCTIP